MQRCVALRLATVNSVVKEWSTEATQAEWTAMSASNNARKQNNICMTNVFQPATDSISKAFQAANACIKNL